VPLVPLPIGIGIGKPVGPLHNADEDSLAKCLCKECGPKYPIGKLPIFLHSYKQNVLFFLKELDNPNTRDLMIPNVRKWMRSVQP